MFDQIDTNHLDKQTKERACYEKNRLKHTLNIIQILNYSFIKSLIISVTFLLLKNPIAERS